MIRLFRRVWFLLRRHRLEAELLEEMETHRLMKQDELERGGETPADAALASRRAMGNLHGSRARARDVWVSPALQDLSQDLRFSLRALVRDRRFTLAAVVALGLGIAVNNSVFTILNAALLRDLPFPEPDRLVEVRVATAESPDRGRGGAVTFPEFDEWRAGSRSFEGWAAHSSGTANVSEAGRPAERLRGTYLSSAAFRLLRSQPILGRAFADADEQPGAASVALVGFHVWQGRYGGDPDIVGRSIRVNEAPTTIVGVMPPGFRFPLTADLWLPLTSAPTLDVTNRSLRNLNILGRLDAGVTLSQARAELEALAARTAQDHPDTNKGARPLIFRLKDSYIVGADRFIGTLMGAVTFVLLIDCANVASLLLARSATRMRDIAIRSSLGASRWRIVRQGLVESTVIAVLAGVVGLVLSRYGAEAMSVAFDVVEGAAPDSATRPYWVNLQMDGSAWTFIGAVCLFASLAVGLVPSWHMSKTDANDMLKEGGRTGAGTRRARRLTGALLVSELALTIVLLAGAGLLIRGFFRLYFTELVIDTREVVTMRLALPAGKYTNPNERRRFIDLLDDRLSAVPGFASVTLASDIPIQPLGLGLRRLEIDHAETPPDGAAPAVTTTVVGPRYFATLGLPITAGRDLVADDGRAGQEGVIVNQRFAERFFEGSAVGRRLRLTSQPPAPPTAWLTVVGVVPSLPNFFANRMHEPVIYLPHHADPDPPRAVSVIVRSAAGKAAAASLLREHVAAVDADLPLFAIQTMEEAVARSRYPSRVIASWFITLAAIALLLATVGLYALTAHGVRLRTHEIGVRMALGASRGQVVWLFVRRTVVQLAIGVTLGLGGAVAIVRLLPVFNGEASARDPLTLTLVAIVLIVVSLAASAWPARRAASIDPATVLRAD